MVVVVVAPRPATKDGHVEEEQEEERVHTRHDWEEDKEEGCGCR